MRNRPELPAPPSASGHAVSARLAPLEPAPGRRCPPLLEGVLAGLVFALADGLAAGLVRTPPALWTLLLVSGALAGLCAGLVGQLARTRGVALGLVVAATLAVHGVSLVTKELPPELPAALRVLCVLAIVALAGATGVTGALGLARQRHAGFWAAFLLASVPATSLLWWALPHRQVFLASACLLPFAVALLPAFVGAWASARSLAAAAILVALALALPVPLCDPVAPRRAVPAPSVARAPADAPSVVLVVIDALRADHLPAPDGSTPELARVAAEGVRFDQAISAAAWTLPGLSSLLTGLLPSRHGAVRADRALAPEVATLAGTLHAAGYETAAFTGGGFASPAFGVDDGFDVFDHLAEFRFRPYRVHTPLVWRAIRNRFAPQRWLLRFVHEAGGVVRLRERVEDWLDHRDPARPFFLLVHTYEVHDYYLYHADPDDELRAEGHLLAPRFEGRLSVHPSEIATASQAELDRFHAVYEKRLGHVDRELGGLLAELEDAVGADRLVTLVTSDHGEGFDAARARIGHGGRLHDDLLRIPLLLRAPGRVAPGTRVAEQVSAVDVLPTLLALCDVPAPEGLDGRSLLPLLDGQDAEARVAFAEDWLRAQPSLALRTSEWKLIDGPEREIYRLADDPHEDRSLADAPDALLRAWTDARARLVPREAPRHTLDGETLQNLRALGYVD